MDLCGGLVWGTGVVDVCEGHVWGTGVMDVCDGRVWGTRQGKPSFQYHEKASQRASYGWAPR